jgi:hypothetical protein
MDANSYRKKGRDEVWQIAEEEEAEEEQEGKIIYWPRMR